MIGTAAAYVVPLPSRHILQAASSLPTGCRHRYVNKEWMWQREERTEQTFIPEASALTYPLPPGGRFVKYDFGPERNMHKYGSTCPPEYNLSRIDSPLYLHYSSGDGVVNYKVKTVCVGAAWKCNGWYLTY